MLNIQVHNMFVVISDNVLLIGIHLDHVSDKTVVVTYLTPLYVHDKCLG